MASLALYIALDMKWDPCVGRRRGEEGGEREEGEGRHNHTSRDGVRRGWSLQGCVCWWAWRVWASASRLVSEQTVSPPPADLRHTQHREMCHAHAWIHVHVGTTMHVHVHVLMRDEKEGRKKQARSNNVHVLYIYTVPCSW